MKVVDNNKNDNLENSPDEMLSQTQNNGKFHFNFKIRKYSQI